MARVLPRPTARWRSWAVLLALLCAPLDRGWARDEPNVEIAVSVPMSGDEASYGLPLLEGAQLAADEANANAAGPRIALKIYDDKGEVSVARDVAGQIVASPARAVIGPAFSKQALEAGPIYAAANMVVMPATATSDLITQHRTTFRVLFKNSDQGRLLALYLSRVLRRTDADVIAVDDGYGQTLLSGFREAAAGLGLTARYHLFKTPEQLDAAARAVAADPAKPPVILLTLDADGSRILTILRRAGMAGPFLGGDAFGDEFFARHFAAEPEERTQPGFFTDGVYAISPMILDSANAEILAFADRYRARFGHDPEWQSAAGYDAAQIAIDGLRALGPAAMADLGAARTALLGHLDRLTDPLHARPGLLGPNAFDADRSRTQAMRILEFHGGHADSAPLQIVPVAVPDPAELASGAVFLMRPGGYGRIQRVVYSGIYLNEVTRIDIAQSNFSADFYVWLRYASNAGPGAADPTDIIFPNMLSGSFDRARPAEERATADGTTYRLWRVRGTFRNDFDLHLFPFDQQRLKLPMFNARAAFDQIVYVLDRRSSSLAAPAPAPTRAASLSPIAVHAADAVAPPGGASLPIADPVAFRDLTQWRPTEARELRDNLVTASDLGDPARIGGEGTRELSGFQLTIGVTRRVSATLAKSLLPLILMTAIMFASLFFPHGLVKEKITVAVTGALSGAVLLTAINSQLGGVGYTVAVEYAFYGFFLLSTVCIVSVLLAERLRVAGRAPIAARTEQVSKAVFLAGVATIAAGAALLWP